MQRTMYNKTGLKAVSKPVEQEMVFYCILDPPFLKLVSDKKNNTLDIFLKPTTNNYGYYGGAIPTNHNPLHRNYIFYGNFQVFFISNLKGTFSE